MRKSKGHNIYLDDKSMEFLDLLIEASPGKASRSSLIREAISLLEEKYKGFIDSALKQEDLKRLGKLIKENAKNN